MSTATGTARGVPENVARTTWPASWLGNSMSSCGVLECQERRVEYRRFCARHAHVYDAVAASTPTVVLEFKAPT